MNVLIDTHVLIWWLKEAKLLRPRVRALLTDATATIHVSAVSAWEIAFKVRLGKLDFDKPFLDDFAGNVRAMSCEPLDIRFDHAVAGARLEGDHRDPFDRLLAGQAKVENLQLVSADPKFKLLGVETMWG